MYGIGDMIDGMREYEAKLRLHRKLLLGLLVVENIGLLLYVIM